MSALALVHTALGSLALGSGALVLLRRKGDRWHRWAGRVYGTSMGALCVLAFGLRDSTPFFQGYGMFHVAAVVSLGTVTLGVLAVRRRREGWLEAHFQWMSWSYIGLLMATGGHVMRPLFLGLHRGVGLKAPVSMGLAVAAVWVAPPLVGAWWIARRAPAWRALGPRGSAPAAGSTEAA